VADVRLTICGRQYDVNCADGQEAQLMKLAALVDEKARSVGGGTETRQLLYASLMLADEAQEASGKSGEGKNAALRAEVDTLKASEATAREALQVAEARIKLLENAPAAMPVAVPAVAPGMTRALEQIADRIEGLAAKLSPQG
jgi:cell division protein ZapA